MRATKSECLRRLIYAIAGLVSRFAPLFSYNKSRLSFIPFDLPSVNVNSKILYRFPLLENFHAIMKKITKIEIIYYILYYF